MDDKKLFETIENIALVLMTILLFWFPYDSYQSGYYDFNIIILIVFWSATCTGAIAAYLYGKYWFGNPELKPE